MRIADGAQGTWETLLTMSSLIRRAAATSHFVEFAKTIRNTAALDTFVRSHFQYQREIGEWLRDPEFMLLELQTFGRFTGDCDDASTWIGAVLRAMVPAKPVTIVAITQSDVDSFSHVFIDSAGSILDPTVPRGTRYAAQWQMRLNV